MEIMPSEYQHIELSRHEKIFVRNIMANDQYGYFLLDTNPAMLPNESVHVLLCADGILLLKFFNELDDFNQLKAVLPILVSGIYTQTCNTIASKLKSNKALVDENGKLKFSINLLYVFPLIERSDVDGIEDADLKEFMEQHCIFQDDLKTVRSNLFDFEQRFLAYSVDEMSTDVMEISDTNVNSILQRIAPEYVTIRVSCVESTETKAGADNELLVVTEDDMAVKAFRLDSEQINIVNKIRKGDQLILACAGSGKSVLLIAKCFKAASMNPDKKFLITCFNNNLYSLYTWFIDRAGLRAKNVTCLTFHTLCKKLLKNHGFFVGRKDFDGWVKSAIEKLNSGKIDERYYGIFIDEVQQFDPEWYKFCYNLLENKNSDDHLFVICGDKTQKLENLQRHGRAPWNAGEGYPNYRGGNKNIRIERNYRNCIEINEYINRYVSCAKQYLYSIDPRIELDPDEFLRGKSVFHGLGVSIKQLVNRSNHGEAELVMESIKEIHDEKGIPYDEIAVIMFNKGYKKHFTGWGNKKYNLETSLMALLTEEDIPFCAMYSKDSNWGARYGDDGGVRFITFRSALGLDFRAAIVCGLLPLGEHNGTKGPQWDRLREEPEIFQQTIKQTEDDIRYLYVACTRAKEILHIVLPESSDSSVFIKILEDAEH